MFLTRCDNLNFHSQVLWSIPLSTPVVTHISDTLFAQTKMSLLGYVQDFSRNLALIFFKWRHLILILYFFEQLCYARWKMIDVKKFAVWQLKHFGVLIFIQFPNFWIPIFSNLPIGLKKKVLILVFYNKQNRYLVWELW